MSTIAKGRWGESLACRHLSDKGFQIIRRNWFFGHAELDLIAWDGPVLVIVEVRLLKRSNTWRPEQTVGRVKQRKIAAAAAAFADLTGYQGELRFDIVGVSYGQDEVTTIRHFPDAFFPGLH